LRFAIFLFAYLAILILALAAYDWVDVALASQLAHTHPLLVSPILIWVVSAIGLTAAAHYARQYDIAAGIGCFITGIPLILWLLNSVVVGCLPIFVRPGACT
jgi:cytosine/uracil/thiamine/allantoin permease